MDKKTFRRHALKFLRGLSPPQRRVADWRVNAALLERIKEEGARTVMLYVPLRDEVNVMPLIGALRRRRVEVLVPFMAGESFRLVQYRLPLRTKCFGVREPIFSRKYRKKQIDIAIVPIAGTDSTGRRIGFGKGMYDRFFAREGHTIARVIFVQRAAQFSPKVITDAWDVRADEILTGF
jgi:5-formyltetrahydrofolate cyclo-ligase